VGLPLNLIGQFEIPFLQAQQRRPRARVARYCAASQRRDASLRSPSRLSIQALATSTLALGWLERQKLFQNALLVVAALLTTRN